MQNTPPLTAKPYDSIPGPKQIPWLGNSLSFARSDRLDWIFGLQKQYGRIVRMRLFSEQVIMIMDPDCLKHILQTNYKDFSKRSMVIEKGKAVLGEGLFTNEGESWRKQRKLAQPAFYKQRLASFAKTMVDCVDDMLLDWEKVEKNQQEVDISTEMMRLTLESVTRTMFSSSISEEEMASFAKTFPAILRETNRRVLNPIQLFDHIPTKGSREYKQNITRLDNIIFRMIKERRTSGEEFDDLLGMLMAARDEESNTGMSEKQLRDEVMTIFIAGHETTAKALTWSFYFLNQHPEVLQTLQQEVKQVLGNRRPTAEDFFRLPYTLQVFKESMRLLPPIPLFVRSTEKDCELMGYQIPPNIRIMIPPYLMHRDPEFWEDPESFDPSRFTPEAEKARHKFTYFPFSGGPRVCIGNNFAMMEAVLTLARVAQRFKVQPVAPEKVEVDFTLTLSPKGGLPSRIVRK